MALVLLADAYARARGGEVIALTVDHALRAESRSEAEQVAAWMKARGITHHILTPEHEYASNNLQENARQWRYDALAAFCEQQGILHCLVAHQAGDNRETLALARARGETADGESGMACVRNYRGVRFVRPLLGFERAELENFLRSEQVAWVDDPSNANANFARVRMRQSLTGNAAENAALDAAIAKGAAAREARDHVLAEATVRCVTLSPLGFATIDLVQWRALQAPLATQLLADCIVTIGGTYRRPRGGDIERLAAALRQPAMRKRTLQYCELSVRGEQLTIAREAARVAGPLTLEGTGALVWDGRFRVRYALPDGHRLTLRALGADGKRHLVQREVHVKLPLATPSLWHLDELVSVPHILGAAGVAVSIGFAPPKPLAAAPFWWLNSDSATRHIKETQCRLSPKVS